MQISTLLIVIFVFFTTYMLERTLLLTEILRMERFGSIGRYGIQFL